MDYEFAGMDWQKLLEDDAPAGMPAESGKPGEPGQPGEAPKGEATGSLAPAEGEKKEVEWSPSMLTQLLPVRRFFPGQTYEPKDLSAETVVNWQKLKRDSQTKGELPLPSLRVALQQFEILFCAAIDLSYKAAASLVDSWLSIFDPCTWADGFSNFLYLC